jgi:hypothetical protein
VERSSTTRHATSACEWIAAAAACASKGVATSASGRLRWRRAAAQYELEAILVVRFALLGIGEDFVRL